MRDSREFPAGHGMAAEEKRVLFARKEFGGGLGDADFGATGVGDERVRRSVARDFRKKIYRRGDGKRDVDEIGVLQSTKPSPATSLPTCKTPISSTSRFPSPRR